MSLPSLSLIFMFSFGIPFATRSSKLCEKTVYNSLREYKPMQLLFKNLSLINQMHVA